ncbi:MAG: protein CpxP [Maribacter sp.]|jgi:protein CpxP|tara:strand:+ start:276 stop:704 length:429 start_codon:yes stop_codon:yes gene_type:complete
MKKLALIVVLLTGVYLTAQRHEGKRNGMKDLNPEQMATLQTKKMTLALDLSQNQQKEVASILLAHAELRKTKQEQRKAKRDEDTKPTKEERFAMQNERLDYMIAHKAEMKKLLTEVQFSKWGKMQHKRHEDRKDSGHGKSKH